MGIKSGFAAVVIYCFFCQFCAKLEKNKPTAAVGSDLTPLERRKAISKSISLNSAIFNKSSDSLTSKYSYCTPLIIDKKNI